MRLTVPLCYTYTIMGTFLKIVVLLLLLAALGLATFYSLNREEIHKEIHTRLESELYSLSGHRVSIGRVGYVPLQSLSLEHVTVYSKEYPDTAIAKVNNMTVTPDIPAIIWRKQFKSTITLDGFRSGDILCNATLRTVSGECDDYKKILDPSLLYSVTLMDAVIGTPYLAFRDIFGIVDIKNLSITGGKIRFSCLGNKCLTEFTARDGDRTGYDMTLRSDDLGLSCTFFKENGNITIDSLDGMLYTFYFELTGEISDAFSAKMACSMEGAVETKLESLAALPGKTGKFARAHPMSGALRSRVFFKITEKGLKQAELTSTFTAENIRIDKFQITEITSKVTVKEGSLSTPLFNGVIYGGALAGNMEMDLTKAGFPYNTSITLNNMDFERLMRDLSGNKEKVYGNLSLGVTLSGSAAAAGSVRGNGRIIISDADLGPMPILTPLLGDIYAAAEKFVPAIKPVKIKEASMDFEIRNHRILTDNLVLRGEDISINSEGYVDFDGNLNLVFENRLLKRSSDKDEEWPEALRNAIVSFGRFLGKTRLTGTMKEPRWTK